MTYLLPRETLRYPDGKYNLNMKNTEH